MTARLQPPGVALTREADEDVKHPLTRRGKIFLQKRKVGKTAGKPSPGSEETKKKLLWDTTDKTALYNRKSCSRVEAAASKGFRMSRELITKNCNTMCYPDNSAKNDRALIRLSYYPHGVSKCA